MAVSENTGGTQSATIGTEHTLATVTTAGTYVLVVDTSALAGGDILELRIYTKVRSGNSSQLAYGPVSYTNVQGALNKYSVPVPANIEFKATLKQTAGTGRSFIWAILQL